MRCPLGSTLTVGLLLAILIPNAAAAATRLILSADPCLIQVCPGIRPPPPTSVESGSFFTLAVLAVDDNGMVDPSFTGTVRFSSTDSSASLPAPYTFTLTDAGMKGFSVALRTLGPQGITGTDAAGMLASGTVTLTVTNIPQCTGDLYTLCLNGGRFTVTATFQQTPEGPSVAAPAVPLTNDTGYFWFFDPTNIELVVKVLTGCAVNGDYWVFAGGLTNVGVEMKVTDTVTGASKSYSNTFGTPFQPIQDSSAFPCP